MNDYTKFVTAFITDLVSRGILAREVNGTWQLAQPILGYEHNQAFKSRDEMIQKLSTAALNQYGVHGGLREAV